jgi:ubiquinone/menaquinone biosynthesis C-methylase UbiE
MAAPSSSELDPRKRGVPHEFDQVAAHYDLLQWLNPGYRANLRRSARRLAAGPRARILDLCCGTGLSTEALRRVYPDAEIDALDASAGMLQRARRRGLGGTVRFHHGDAMDLAEAGLNGPYHGILMAYGIRNLPDPDRGLREVLRVLAPGSIACWHEYSVRDSWRSRALWNAVSLGLVMPLGRLTSPGSDLYRYLRRSVLDFDGVRAFEDRLRRAGFVDVRTEPLWGWSWGIVHSFLGRRPR